MALDELLQAIERGTGDEIRAVVAAGEAEASRIEGEATRERAERVATAVATFAAERRGAADAELAAALQHARADMLSTRAAMLDRIRDALRGELPAIAAGDGRLAPALIAAALACAGDETGTLRCAPTFAEAARRAAPATVRVVEDAEVATGVVIELATGTRIDATLAALLEREWPQLACEALALEHRR